MLPRFQKTLIKQIISTVVDDTESKKTWQTLIKQIISTIVDDTVRKLIRQIIFYYCR